MISNIFIYLLGRINLDVKTNNNKNLALAVDLCIIIFGLFIDSLVEYPLGLWVVEALQCRIIEQFR